MEVSRPPEYASTTFFGHFVLLVNSRCYRLMSSVSRIAFCTCRRFSACSKTMDRGESMMPSVTSESAVRRKAMHEDGVRRGAGEQRFVHLVIREGSFTHFGFFFLAHAGPYIGIDGLRARDGFFGCAEDFDFATRLARDTFRVGHNSGLGSIACRRGDANMRADAPGDGAASGTCCCRRRHRQISGRAIRRSVLPA